MLITFNYPHYNSELPQIKGMGVWIKKVNRFGKKKIKYYICIIDGMFCGINKKKERTTSDSYKDVYSFGLGYEPLTIQR